MAAIVYSKQMFIERVKKQIAGDFTGSDFKVTDNEILLLIDAGIPFVLKGQMFDNVKVTGVFEVPDAYITTYLISPITRNAATNEWVGTLPQTPLALPTGYNITDAYISQPNQGRQSIFITSNKRVPYRNNLPKPSGLFARVEYNKIYLQSPNGMPLNGQDLYVQMPISRTSDVNEPMTMPDDAIQPLFDYVVGKIAQRFSLPKDIVQDNLPSGNKSS